MLTPPFPMRLTTRQVCEIAGFSEETLRRRIKAGRMPTRIDRARQNLFDRDEVLRALGMKDEEQGHSPWAIDPDAFRQARARKPWQKWRDRSPK